MPTAYEADGYQGYDLNTGTNVATLDPDPSQQFTGGITGYDQNDNGTFEAGEDITSDGNDYLGYVTIDGVDMAVVYGSTSGVTDLDYVSIIVPDYLDTASISWPASIDFNVDLVTAPFTTCFAAGTAIATPDGEVGVETLQPGDMVLTADGRAVAVRWLGQVTRNTGLTPNMDHSLVRIGAGALGHGLPKRDLVVTGEHGLVLDGHLVNACALVNGSTIRFEPAAAMADRVTVYHVETDSHEALLAEGVAAESFADATGRAGYDNHAEYVAMFGAERIIPEMDLPRVASARLLPAELRATLGLDADDLGMALSA